MQTNRRTLLASLAIGSVALTGALGSAGAADDKWFVLGQTTLKTTDPSASIKSEGSRWDKDVKQVKLSVEGADVQITNVVLHWDNRPDDTISVGTLKSGGESAPAEAPMRKGRLKGVTLQYKVIGDAPATIKVWGYD